MPGQADVVAEFSWTEISAQEELIAGHSDLLPVALHLARSWRLNQGAQDGPQASIGPWISEK